MARREARSQGEPVTREEYFKDKSPKCAWRVARVFKRCWECNGEIREDDRYLDTGMVVIDKYVTAKICLRCARADVPK